MQAMETTTTPRGLSGNEAENLVTSSSLPMHSNKDTTSSTQRPTSSTQRPLRGRQLSSSAVAPTQKIICDWTVMSPDFAAAQRLVDSTTDPLSGAKKFKKQYAR